MYSMEAIEKAILSQKEQFLFECFERHGYDRSRVETLAKQKRVSVSIDNEFGLEFYFIDGENIFTISRTIKCDDDGRKVTYTFREELLENEEQTAH